MTIDEFKSRICGKKTTVVGIGVSNMPLIDFLLSCGAEVTACDKKKRSEIKEQAVQLEQKGVPLKLGKKYLKDIDAQVIFKSPGIRPDIPEFNEARKKGAVVTSEMELFFELCPCEIIAVTGSDGKTTTTTLIGEMLKKEGFNCYIGGNIGKPLIGEVEKMSEADKAILELSSFQLFTMRKSPHIAVITNVSPNHLDWHTDYDEYIEAKKNIMNFQNEDNLLVVNSDNDITDRIGKQAKSAVRTFSSKKDADVCLKNGEIVFRGEKVINAEDIIIPGAHNVENYMTAIAAVGDCVSRETIEYVAKNFGGVEHRIEFVREVSGVKFYNDSIASSPTRTMAALDAFDKKLILIAGGYDKKIPFDELGFRINEKVKELVLVGKTSKKIKKATQKAGKETKITVCRDFEQAVLTAYKKATPGDVVILSPACASFDLFKNFMIRGKTFKQIVNNIQGRDTKDE